MGERKVAGWVVALMPEKKGEPREYYEWGGADMSTDKSRREVFTTYMEATGALRLVAEWLDEDDFPRLRILPLYAKQERTVAKERADVVAWLEKKFDRKVADEVAEGAHVGAAK
jgi:hypothetical protein